MNDFISRGCPPRAHLFSRPVHFSSTFCLRSILLLFGLALFPVPGSLRAQAVAAARPDKTPVQLSAVEVRDTYEESEFVTAPTAAEAIREIATIPGGAAVISTEEIAGASANVADLIANQPGVQVRNAGGRNEAGIVSVRGAGTNNGGPFGNTTKGVSIFINGLPVTTPGAYAFEAPDTLATEHVEVLRGSSALTYGSLSLGGGINYVYHTGYTADRLRLKLDFGSFGYYRAHASSGYVFGKLDYFASLTASHQDGFRDNSNGDSRRVSVNLGYRFTPHFESRLFFHYIKSEYQNPRVLTEPQMYANPRQVSPELGTGLRGGLNRNAPGTFIVQQRNALTIDESSGLELSYEFLHFPTNTLGARTVPLAISSKSINHNEDFSVALIYRREDEFFGRRGRTKISLTGSVLTKGDTEMVGDAYNPSPGVLLQRYDTAGRDWVASLSHDYEVLRDDRLLLTSALALSRKTRSGDAILPVRDHSSRRYTNYAPQIGLLYKITSDLQLVSNVSRLTEAPSAQTQIPNTIPTTPYTITDVRKRLREQEALSAELGVRGKIGQFEGGLTYYHQILKNEILTVSTGPTTTATTNASPTLHRGIEFNLKTTLWQSSSSAPAPSAARPSRLVLTSSYTWADNHYRGDPLLGKNELPGLASQYYAAELLFQDASGLYGGINLTGILTAVPIDYANSPGFYTNPYTLLGAKFGYASRTRRWEVYLDFRNITDEIYASVINPIYDAVRVANIPASLAAVWPGDGFNVTTGVTIRF